MPDVLAQSSPEDIAALERIDRDERIVAERSRLERAVVEAAKAYGRAARAVEDHEDHMKTATEAEDNSRAGWRLLRDLESREQELMLEAVWPLLDFESQQTKK